ncbi:hypothetical protein Cni_G02056 [Canna indica]|uniref:Uncharacterized protein n=1 Tax=Canna indica TaxID=4628 RepID=A0AAQ3JQL6_9LILI|nr:hypothetical protein Cni_G02056 [Canna indica]
MSIEKLELFLSEYDERIHGSVHEDHQDLQKEPREEHHSDSSCDSISDEENTVLTKLSVASSAANKFRGSPYVGSVSKDHKGEWSKITEEAMELSCLHKKACCSSFISHLPEEKSHKSGRSRAKAKFSIHPQLLPVKLLSSHAMDRYEKSSVEASKNFVEDNNIHHRTFEDSKAKLLEYIDNQEPPAKLAPHELMSALPSMAELLEDLQEKNGQTTEDFDLKLSKTARSKERKRLCSGRIAPCLGSRILDNDDPLELMGSGTSSGDEDCNQNQLSSPREKIKQRTMGDLFLETFNTYVEGSTSVFKNRNTGSGYFGRLQQVIQIERDRHLEFLKQLQTGGSSPNDLSCITARILSRCLEAKLTVCHCMFAESTKRQPEKEFQEHVENVGTPRTVIFHSKMCGNVELEVGSFIRIHPPWKEVPGKNGEKIILCSYFSQSTE